MLTSIDFKAGDTVKVHQKIQEGDKTRIQVFKGMVLGIRGRTGNKMFTVQKMVGQIAVERIWPVDSPNIEKVEIEAHAKKRVRRARISHVKISNMPK